jgi:hypothetical protein
MLFQYNCLKMIENLLRVIYIEKQVYMLDNKEKQ